MYDRNKKLREIFNATMEENGLMLKFAAKKTGLVDCSMSRWRHGHFDYSDKNLDLIQEFCERYEGA